jgi:uncharacterized protein (TIGR02466 family)
MGTWPTPIFAADFPHAPQHLPALREIILDHEADPGTANFGGIDALKSSQKILTWHHPAIDWVKGCIAAAVTDLTRAELGEAADEITHGVQVEGWAVVYREGGSLRPHRHHDSAWSGVLYIEVPDPCLDEGTDAGYLQLLDPRTGAVARDASSGSFRIQPRPGRMIAFPGWVTHSVTATVHGGGLRIALAWNVAYDKTWTGMS